MNTKIHKLLVFILATSSALSPIISHAMPTDHNQGQIGVIMGSKASDVAVLREKDGLFIYDTSGPHPYPFFRTENKGRVLSPGENITLVFGSKHNLKVEGAADKIKQIDIHKWSSKKNPITIDLHDAINSGFTIINQNSKRYTFSDQSEVPLGEYRGAGYIPGYLDDGVINFNIHARQTFGSMNSNPFSRIGNVDYKVGDIGLTLGCGYDDLTTALDNTIATTFASKNINNQLIFNQIGKYIALSGENKGVNFAVFNGTMGLTNKNTGTAYIGEGGTLKLQDNFTGDIFSDNPGHGVLELDSIAQVSGSVGAENCKLNSIKALPLYIAGRVNSISGDVFVNKIEISDGAFLDVKGNIKADSLIFPGEYSGSFQYNIGRTLLPVNMESGNGGTQILAEGKYIADQNVESNIILSDATLVVNNGFDLKKTVTAASKKRGLISFEGKSTIANNIGSTSSLIESISLEPGSIVSTDYSQVDRSRPYGIYGNIALKALSKEEVEAAAAVEVGLAKQRLKQANLVLTELEAEKSRLEGGGKGMDLSSIEEAIKNAETQQTLATQDLAQEKERLENAAAKTAEFSTSGNIHGDVSGLGNLVLNDDARVIGSVGTSNVKLSSIKAMDYNTVDKNLFVQDIIIGKGASLTVGKDKGQIIADSVSFIDDKGSLRYSSPATLVPVKEKTNSEQILNKGTYTAAHDVNSKLRLCNAELHVLGGVSLSKDVIVEDLKKPNSAIHFSKGESKISGNIGSKHQSLSMLGVQSESKVTLKTDASWTDTVLLGDQSKITITGSLYGNIHGLSQSDVQLNIASIFGSVGQEDGMLRRIILSEGKNSIQGNLFVDTIEIQGEGSLGVGGNVIANSLKFANGSTGSFEYNANKVSNYDATLFFLNAPTDGRQILNTGTYTAAHDVYSEIILRNSILNVENNVNLRASVVSSEGKNNAISFKGESEIFGDIGSKDSNLRAISVEPGARLTMNADIYSQYVEAGGSIIRVERSRVIGGNLIANIVDIGQGASLAIGHKNKVGTAYKIDVKSLQFADDKGSFEYNANNNTSYKAQLVPVSGLTDSKQVLNKGTYTADRHVLSRLDMRSGAMLEVEDNVELRKSISGSFNNRISFKGESKILGDIGSKDNILGMISVERGARLTMNADIYSQYVEADRSIIRVEGSRVIDGSLKADIVDMAEGASLAIGHKDKLNTAYKIDVKSLQFADDKGSFEYSANNNNPNYTPKLVPVSGLTDSKQVLNKGTYTADRHVLSRLDMRSGAMLDVEDNVDLHKRVSFAGRDNTISFKGNSKILQNIGVKNKDSGLISLEGKSGVTVEGGVKIYGAVNLKDGSQLTIKDSGYLLSADAAKNSSGVGIVVAGSGSEVGNIGGELPIAKFSATDAKLFGAKYNATSVVLSGVNKLTNQNVEISNLTTQHDAKIDASESSLKLGGSSCSISDKTTILLSLKSNALHNTSNKAVNVSFASDTNDQILLRKTKLGDILAESKFYTEKSVLSGENIKILNDQTDLFKMVRITDGDIDVSSSGQLGAIFKALGKPSDETKPIGPVAAKAIIAANKSPKGVKIITQSYAPIDTLRVAQSVASMMYDNLVNQMDLINLDSSSRDRELKFFISPLVGVVALPLSGDVVATTSQIGGTTFGGFYNLKKYQTNLGLVFTVAQLSIDSICENKKAMSGIGSLSAFVRKKFENKFVLDIVATMQMISGSLNQILWGQNYQGDRKTTFASVSPKIGYEMSLSDELKFTPYAGAYIDYCKQDAVILKADESSQSSSGEQTKQRYIVLVGGRLVSSNEYSLWHLQPFIDVSFRYNNKPSVDEGDVLNDESENFNIKWKYDQDPAILASASVGVQVKADNSFNAILSVGANAPMGGNSSVSWRANVTINYTF